MNHWHPTAADIDDKIIKRANEAGEDPLALSARFISEYHEDMRLLGCLPPTVGAPPPLPPPCAPPCPVPPSPKPRNTFHR